MSNMALTYNEKKAVYEFANGTRIVQLTPAEVSFISHALERNNWAYEIDMEIESNEECIDFSAISREEFHDLCLEELESRWGNGWLNCDPDYQCIVFDVAQEQKIWRN